MWGNYVNPDTFEKTTGIKIIDEGPQIKALNEEICNMYTGYYEFDSNGEVCFFNIFLICTELVLNGLVSTFF